MADNEVKVLGWDGGISAEANSEEFQVPPIGEYEFFVADFEQSTSKSGYPMAVLTLSLNVNGSAYERKDYITLTNTMEWKIASFFECIGLKKKGEALQKMPWDKVRGKEGRCKLEHEEYNGKTYGKVTKYLPMTGSAAEAATAPAQDMPFEI